LAREANILSYLSHPNIVKIYGTTAWGCNAAIVMELVEGGKNLKHLLESEKVLNLPWCVRLHVALGITAGLGYMHGHDPSKVYCHGDLKPENILLTKGLKAKLADFGGSWVQRAVDASTMSIEITPNKQGTKNYAAPELFKHLHTDKTPEADVYR